MSDTHEGFWESIFKHGLRSKYLKPILGEGTGIGNWWKGTTGSGLTNAQIQANDFSAEEAQKQRDWETEMDNTKFQRQTADMQSAGLNPAMLYGQSIGVSSAPSGASASSVDAGSPSGGLLSSLMDIIFAKQRLANMKAEEGVLKSQENKNYEEAGLARSNRALSDVNTRLVGLTADAFPSVNAKTLEKLTEEVNNLRKDIDVKDADISDKSASAALKDSQRIINEHQNQWIDRLNSAKEQVDKASAARDIAEEAMTNLTRQYLNDNNVLPGTNSTFTLFAGLASVLDAAGLSEENIEEAISSATSIFKEWLKKGAKYVDENVFKRIAETGD